MALRNVPLHQRKVSSTWAGPLTAWGWRSASPSSAFLESSTFGGAGAQPGQPSSLPLLYSRGWGPVSTKMGMSP